MKMMHKIKHIMMSSCTLYMMVLVISMTLSPTKKWRA